MFGARISDSFLQTLIFIFLRSNRIKFVVPREFGTISVGNNYSRKFIGVRGRFFEKIKLESAKCIRWITKETGLERMTTFRRRLMPGERKVSL